MPTQLFPLTAEKLRLEALPLNERITAWGFFNVKGIDTTTRDGGRVSIHGVTFSGSPVDVFWHGFFDPFMLSAATETLQWVMAQCKERNLPPEEYMDEARQLIHEMVRVSYRDIARVDQRLRGNGFPEKVGLRDVSQNIDAVLRKVDALSVAVMHRAPAPVLTAAAPEDVVELKPNFLGFGVNLNALYRWFRRNKP